MNNQIPPELLQALIKQESGGNPNAVSPKGAQGIMQIMPDTARDPGYGVKPLQGWDGVNPKTAPVEEQIRFGRDYLNAMSNKFDGNTQLALAAYNAGPGAVEQNNGVPPYKETQQYVQNIMSDVNTTSGKKAKPWEKYGGGQAAGQKPWEQYRGEQPIKPAKSKWSFDNPMPGAELAPPLYDYDPVTGEEIEIPWWEQGDEFWANQRSQSQGDTFRPRYFSEHLPIPVNKDAWAVTGQAVGRGVADLVGAPFDLYNLAQSGLTSLINIPLPKEWELAQPYPVPGSDAIANDFSRLAKEYLDYPVQDPDQMSETEKRGYNMVRFGAGAGAGGLGLASKAGKVSQAAQSGQKVGKIEQALTAPYVERPMRQVADDVAAGAGAGYGMSIAEEEFPDSPMAQIAGAMLGGGAGSVGTRTAENLVRAPFKKVQNSLPVTLPDGTKESRRTMDDSARLMQAITTNPEQASQNLKSMNKMVDEGGMTRMTTGVAADDVGLGAAEVQMRSREPRQYLERDQQVRTDVSRSVNDLRDPNADIKAPQNLARGERDRLMNEATGQADEAQQSLTTAKQKQVDIDRETEQLIDPITQQRGRGAEVSKQLDEQIGMEGALGERTKAKNQAFDEAAGGDVVDISPLTESVERVKGRLNELGSLGEASGLPGDFVSRVKKIAKKGEGVPLKDVSGIRKNISTAISKARQAGNFDLVDDLSTLKKDINEFVDNTASFDDAQKYYREEYAPFFAEGYGKKYRDTVQRGEGVGASDPGKVANIFLNGTPDAAADLKRIVDIAPDPQAANDAVRRYMAADLASSIGANASPRTIANWIKNRSAQLDQFPDLKKEFQNLQKKIGAQEVKKDSLRAEIDQLANEFKRAEKNVDLTRRRIEKGVLGTLINADPDRYVKKLMSGDDRLQKLDEVNKLIGKNKEAQEGLKRAVTEHVLDTITGSNVKMVDNVEGPIQYAQIAKVMKQNEDALAKVYTPKEMNALRRAQKMLSQYGNLARRGTIGSDTVEKARNENLITALETALRVKYGVLKTGGIMRTIKGAAKMLPEGRVAKADRVVAQAMLDPELAVMLLDTPVNKLSDPKWHKKLTGVIAGSAAGRKIRENAAGEDDSLIFGDDEEDE